MSYNYYKDYTILYFAAHTYFKTTRDVVMIQIREAHDLMIDMDDVVDILIKVAHNVITDRDIVKS